MKLDPSTSSQSQGTSPILAGEGGAYGRAPPPVRLRGDVRPEYRAEVSPDERRAVVKRHVHGDDLVGQRFEQHGPGRVEVVVARRTTGCLVLFVNEVFFRTCTRPDPSNTRAKTSAAGALENANTSGEPFASAPGVDHEPVDVVEQGRGLGVRLPDERERPRDRGRRRRPGGLLPRSHTWHRRLG